MAHILKSNAAVNDADNRYAYYTPYGVATQELAAYASALEATGYTMSQAEFNGFKTFIKNLTDNLIWDKVYEVYPLFGKNLDGALVKLKSKNGISKMTAIDGFDNSMLEIVNDKVKGKAVTAASSKGNTPRLDTGLALSEVLPSMGMHVYMGNAEITTGSLWQPVIGVAGAENASLFAALTQLAVNTNISQVGAALSHPNRTSAEVFTNTPSIFGYQGNPRIAGVSSQGVFYKNGTSASVVAPTNLEVSDTTATLALFGRNAPYASTTGTVGYSGIVRFACITSGYLDDAQVTTLHSEINKLLILLGKIA